MNTFLQLVLDARQRAADRGEALSPSAYDPSVPDARCSSERQRGNVWHREWGTCSEMFCGNCGKPAPYLIADAFVKTFYFCTPCMVAHKVPQHLILIPSTVGT